MHRGSEICLGNSRMRAVFTFLLCIAISCGLTSCASLERLPAATYDEAKQANILNIPDARFYVSETALIDAIALKAYQRRNLYRTPSTPFYILANSGGGDDGAFGAGLLVGWSARGDRPVFDVVTGISTGALTAPFAFLGKDYDRQLTEIYTQTSAQDVFERRPILAAVTNDAMTNNAPLREMVDRYLDDTMLKRIADEYKKGRLLFVLTTNLDQGRPVIWNIGAIAESNNPEARELIVNVLLASASIPGVFPPVMLDLTINGQKYQEMHVDGGTIAQAFLYPPSFSLRRAAASLRLNATKFRDQRKRIAYIIRNGRLVRPEESVKLQTIAIAKQAIATMTASSGVNDTYRMYLMTRRDGVDFNLASIGDDFDIPYQGPFDKNYMQTLFEYAYQKGRAGYHWQKVPPGFAK